MFAVKVCKVNCVKHLYLYEKHATLFCAKHNFLRLLKCDYKLEKTLLYISFLFRKYLKEAKKNLASNEKKRKNHHEKNPQTNGPIISEKLFNFWLT